MLPAGNNCFGTRATSHCHPLSGHPTANCQLPLPTPTSHSHPLDLAHIVTRKSCSTAKYINGEAFKICATFALRCFNFWHLRGANSTTSKRPDGRPPGKGPPTCPPATQRKQWIHSFVYSFKWQLHFVNTFVYIQLLALQQKKKKLAEIKPAPKTG